MCFLFNGISLATLTSRGGPLVCYATREGARYCVYKPSPFPWEEGDAPLPRKKGGGKFHYPLSSYSQIYYPLSQEKGQKRGGRGVANGKESAATTGAIVRIECVTDCILYYGISPLRSQFPSLQRKGNVLSTQLITRCGVSFV